ncbi:MAG: biopolymer transporter ExbD [Desulfomicrobium sp.]|jgi:biopolymer transport protein ExbD|nr:biopolymer transporter ExbD [Desulfomicrobium sp.]NLW04892.1 biopolymer transporter ExbD [Pseudomonadaceae bacterium]
MLDFSEKQDIEENDIDLTSLMDMVFILLIFFVIASAFTVRGMKLDLPPAQSSQGLSGRVINLRLDAQGNIYHDEVHIPKNQLRPYIHDLVRGLRSEPGQLVLQSDPKAPVDALILLVDEVRMQGGEQLMIATSSPATKKMSADE